MSNSVWVGVEPLVVCQCLKPQRGAQKSKMSVAADSNDDGSIGGGEQLLWSDAGVGVAHPRGRGAGG